jgi:hypothetical protein
MSYLGRIIASTVFAWVVGVNPAFANAYDDCILQYMAGAQNKDAIAAIERSCISKTSFYLLRTTI